MIPLLIFLLGAVLVVGGLCLLAGDDRDDGLVGDLLIAAGFILIAISISI